MHHLLTFAGAGGGLVSSSQPAAVAGARLDEDVESVSSSAEHHCCYCRPLFSLRPRRRAAVRASRSFWRLLHSTSSLKQRGGGGAAKEDDDEECSTPSSTGSSSGEDAGTLAAFSSALQAMMRVEKLVRVTPPFSRAAYRPPRFNASAQ